MRTLTQIFCMMAVVTGLCAQERDPEVDVLAAQGRGVSFSIGPQVGVPTGIGLRTGLWNLGGGGFITGSAGFHLGISGELEGGWLFDNDGSFKQGVSLHVGAYEVLIPLFPYLAHFAGLYVGPAYKMLFWDLIYLDIGAAFAINFAKQETFFLIPVTSQCASSCPGFTPIVNAGMQWFF